MASAPTDTAFGHTSAAVVGHLAAASGGGLGDVAHFGGSHGGENCIRAIGHLVAVGSAHFVNGVGSHVVGLAWFKVGELDGEGARSRTVVVVCIAYGGLVFGAPADAALGDGCAAVVGHFTVSGGAFDGACRHGRLGGCSNEFKFATIGCALCVGGIGSQIVFGVGG